MTGHAPRSIEGYLNALRDALAGEDRALIQDALYDAEEYLRAEVAAHPGRSEADVLELIATTYGAPDEVAAAYKDTEAKVKAALQTPVRTSESSSAIRKFFGVFSDPRAYMSLFFMLLALATGIVYFTFAVTGLALSAGLAVLIIGIPFFLIFIGMARVISLGEGRLLEAVTGERMPRRPVHPGPQKNLLNRILDMITDTRTWTTLAYFLLMLPLGIAYFTIAIFGLSVGMSLFVVPFFVAAHALGLLGDWGQFPMTIEPWWLGTVPGLLLLLVVGVVILTALLHIARGTTLLHTRVAKALLVTQS
jgi:uncharacterized membrane protein